MSDLFFSLNNGKPNWEAVKSQLLNLLTLHVWLIFSLNNGKQNWEGAESWLLNLMTLHVWLIFSWCFSFEFADVGFTVS